MKFQNVLIKSISPLEQGVSQNGNQWQKMSVVVEDDSHEYGDSAQVVFINDRVRLLDGRKVGDHISMFARLQVHTYTDPQGREHVFNEVRGISIS